MSHNVAIRVEKISKCYSLYNSPLDRLKEALSPFRQKFHHDFYALSDVSFEIKKGETVGIIGSNGSGKSTLLKIICGVLTPTSGRVTVNGRISALLELGAGFNPELTGMENVYFNGTLMGYSKVEMDAKLDEILSFADIGKFIYQPVKTYSSGMFVRLAFAVAICVDPDILIVDEALSVGDVKFQRKCFSKIEDFSTRHKTILFVSHATSVVNNLCNNAILFSNGKLLGLDAPRIITKLYHEMIFGDNNKKNIDGDSLTNNMPAITLTPNCNYIDTNKAIDVLLKSEVLKLLIIKEPDFSTQELRNGNGTAEIIDYGILDSAGNRVQLLSSGEQYTFFQKALFYKDVHRFFVAFAIRDVQGAELFYTNTEILHVSLSAQKKGSVLGVNAKISMWLAPGEYFLSCILFDKEKSDYSDRRLDVLHFSVSTNVINGGGYVNLSPVMDVNELLPASATEEYIKIIKSEDKKTFYSQHGEDVILDTIFDGVKDGFFVEVGCIDGKRFSNTLTFEERGWTGICVEAHSDYIELLRKNRPNSEIVHCAVGDVDEDEVSFYANSRGSLSTLDPSQEENFKTKFGKWFTGFEKQRVPKMTLDTIFEKMKVAKINLLSIDIEGTEIEALRGMNVEKWKPEVIIIETEAHDEEIIDSILYPIGYKKVYRIPNNTFYSILDLPNYDTGTLVEANVVHTQHPLDDDDDKIIRVELHV